MDESKLYAQRVRFAGSYVAWRDDAVVVSAATYDELCDRLNQLPIDQRTLIIEYLRRTDVIYI